MGLLKRLGLTFGSILLALLIVESTVRYRDSYALRSIRLRGRTPLSQQISRGQATPSLIDHARKVPVRPGIDLAWFQVDPPDVVRRPVDPALQARYDEFERRDVYEPQSFYVWNPAFADMACGEKRYVFRNFPRDVKEFESPEATPFPTYRFPPNQTLPSGLVTNQFGFRGPAVAPHKDAGLIRIAFVGASTTQNLHTYRWSYPEITGAWLNLWLQHHRRTERVEVVNAGREGINSPDIREIVKREVVPLQPDYVVYLEGADLVSPPAVTWPGGRPPAAPPMPTSRAAAWTGGLAKYSAFAKRLNSAIARLSGPTLGEPPKPRYELELPSPDRVTLDQLSSVFGTFLQNITVNLDEDRRSVSRAGARLILSTVIRLVHDGLRLDPLSQAVTYQQLNTLFKPLTYADIRRLVDLQNAAYRLYAADRGIDLIDVAAQFPEDTALFLDTFHLNERGIRLQAWLAFLRLTEILERDFNRLSVRPAASSPAPASFPRIIDATLPSCTP